MKNTYIENKIIEKEDFTSNKLEVAEYEKCKFVNCNFSNSDLTNVQFLECLFLGCNLSNASLNKTAFKETNFKDCKLLGLHFHNCNEFLLSVNFDNCQLNLSSFFRLKIKKTKFRNCSLQEADFTETDLSGAVFENCDLSRTVFDGTNLEKADLRTSYNYMIDPELNKIKRAKFSLQGIPGLLFKYDIEVE
ncbi:MAG: pentapeptide repeat-containing protein [Bacteroidetes bacterium]|nr:pentapeptide repeat-containing protein [Bacteroidota bacterium]